MKFLIVFFALMMHWRLPIPAHSAQSRTFAAWLAQWQKIKTLENWPAHVRYALIVVLPTLLLASVFWYSEQFAWGLITFVLEILLLLYVLIHADTKQHLDQYQQQLRENDIEAAYRCAEQHLALPEAKVSEDPATLNEQVIKALLHRWFEYFFLIVFWYMVADVAGILLAWFTVQYARATKEESQENIYLHILEWVPVRLLGITFGVAGNLMCTLPVLRNYLWQWRANSEDVLFDIASAALADGKSDREWHSAADNGEAAAEELEEWQQLHIRCVSVWLVMIAVATIGGWLL